MLEEENKKETQELEQVPAAERIQEPEAVQSQESEPAQDQTPNPVRESAGAVFRDSSFANSPAKINVTEIFKLLAPDTRVKVI